MYNSNISRLRAEEDLRLLQISACSQSGEAFQKLAEKLQDQLGISHKEKPSAFVEAEAGALDKLKRLQGG